MTIRLLVLGVVGAQLWAQSAVDGVLSSAVSKAPDRMARAALPSERASLHAVDPIVLPLLDVTSERVANRRGAMPLGSTRTLTALPGEWSQGVWRAALQSPGATSIRARFVRFSVGRGRVWVYGSTGDVEGQYSGTGPYEDGDFWSATVAGDRITIEYEPEVATTDPPSFQIVEVAHFWQQVAAPPPAPNPFVRRFLEDVEVTYPAAAGGEKSVAACHLDYKCHAEWQQAGSGVAHIVFQSSSDNRFYVCTGALINTRTNSQQPLFLTANHCLGNDTETRTLQAYWFYESAQCNGPTVTRAAAMRVDGARFLAGGGQGEGDFSLVLLNGLPPNRAVWFAGWQNQDPALGSSLIGIHHPDGSYKRIAFGARVTDRAASVGGQAAPAARFLQVQMTDGRIEGGSSGSPLFDAGGRIVGALSYGSVAPPGQSECDIANFRAGYGRFTSAYETLRHLLEDGVSTPSSVTPQTLSFRGADGIITGPATQSLRVETTSADAVSFSITTSTPWIRLSAQNGTASASTPFSFDVTIDAAQLRSTGSSTGNVTIQAASALPLSVSVRVDLAATRSAPTATVNPTPVYEQNADREGYKWFFDIRLQERAGVESRLTLFRYDGTDYSSRIVEFFGSNRIPALGTLSASLRVRDIAVPREAVIDLAGLDSSGQTWSQRISARFLGRRQEAQLTVTSDPETVQRDPDSADCAWRHRITVTEGAGIGVNLSRWIAGSHDLSGAIADWFGSKRLDPNGSVNAGICWRGLIVPTSLSFELGGTDDLGNDVRATASVQFAGAPGEVPRLQISPAQVTLVSPNGSLTERVNVNLNSQRISWSARVTYAGAARSWLTVFPTAGVSDSTLTLSVLSLTAQQLAAGVYQATVSVDAPGAEPSRIELPVQLRIGGAAPPPPRFTRDGVVNAASFRNALATGMLFTILGENLAQSDQSATRLPLATSMGGTLVRANGVLCPLLYVSARQINAQLPYEIAPGNVNLAVSVGGAEATAAVEVRAVAPGVFTADGTRPVPHQEGRRGDSLTLYVTGAGLVTPTVATGDQPPLTTADRLPRPQQPVRLTVGGVPAEISFAGIPRGISGAIQVNYRVPDSAPLGDQPLVVSVGTATAPQVLLRIRP
ncbi:MAG: trypsin-like peptidase domain-containing protein [Bryobacteraceae bacterium]